MRVIEGIPFMICLQEADTDDTGEAGKSTQQTLTFYELDLGLNHVVRKYAEPLKHFGSHLISGMYINVMLWGLVLALPSV